MANTPNVQAPLWASTEASPWLMSGKRARIFDAFANAASIESRAATAPPGACADGARYLIAAGATGAWATHDGQLAIAVGTNAANGWYFVAVAVEGFELYIRDENAKIRHNGAAWVAVTDSVSRLQDLHDVDTTGLADGLVLKWDASNGVFYFAADLQSAGGADTDTESIIIAASDESTALTAGTGKVTFRMPYAFTLTAIRASLVTAQVSGSIFTVDVNESGTSIISTKLTIDNTEKTSTTAATPPVISDAALADDAEMTIDIDQIGDGSAAGLKIVLIGHQ